MQIYEKSRILSFWLKNCIMEKVVGLECIAVHDVKYLLTFTCSYYGFIIIKEPRSKKLGHGIY